MEWFPGRVFAFFRRAAKEGRSRRSETTSGQTPIPAAAGKTPVPVIAKPRKGLWQSVSLVQTPVPAAAGKTPVPVIVMKSLPP